MNQDPQSYRLTPAHVRAGYWVCECGSSNEPDDIECWNCEEIPDEGET